MPKRYIDTLVSLKPTIAYGLRTRLREGYTRQDLRADVMAGLVVGVIALPLSMALAVASGVPPQHGLYTAIVAGVVTSLIGGTRAQVSGPTAAFVVILVPIVTQFGLGGLLVAGLMAGLILMIMAWARLGALIQFIPHPVTTGFTAGIAVVIATLQLKDLFGLTLSGNPESYLERWQIMWSSMGTFSIWELATGATTLALLLVLPKVQRKIPAPLVALLFVTVAVELARHYIPGFTVDTIASRFQYTIDGVTGRGIPPLPPTPVWPWQMPGPDGTPLHLDWTMLRALLPSAFAIAMLGAIESLLAAVVADGMTGTRHDSNGELFSLGLANLAAPFFGGIAATGALARTATNIRAGAQSPLAAVFHALFVLACTVALAPFVSYLPMAALAALLLIVAKNMAEVRHFAHIVRVAPRNDVVVLLTCFLLTVLFDMVVAVAAGVVLAALLFMGRMARLSTVHLDANTSEQYSLPPGVRLYEIAGPLFFGAAQKAMGALETVGSRQGDVTVLLLSQVPCMDHTALVALETVLSRLKAQGQKVILAGLNPQPAELLARAGIGKEAGRLAIVADLDSALSLAIVHSARHSGSEPVSQ